MFIIMHFFSNYSYIYDIAHYYELYIQYLFVYSANIYLWKSTRGKKTLLWFLLGSSYA